MKQQSMMCMHSTVIQYLSVLRGTQEEEQKPSNTTSQIFLYENV